jgi:hypothetical protein
VTRDQAIEVLRCYRPGIDDPPGPEVVSALEWVARDPELAAWHRGHLALQDRIQSQFRSIPVPELLHGLLVEAERVRHQRARIVRLRWVGVCAAAACLALLGLGLWWRPSSGSDNFNVFRDRMVRTALREYRMEMVTGELPRIRDFLRQKGGPADWTLAPALAHSLPIGCAGLRWQNHPVSLVCFNSSRGGTLYLFIARAADLQGAPAPDTPHDFRSINRMSTVCWSAGTNTFLLATRDAQEDLRRLVQ